MDTRKNEGLQALGRKTEYRQDYDPSVLEAFENRHQENDYWVRFNCPEFTSLCPITGQPDFAEIRIGYIPDVRMVESKSLKLYLFSFRNHGAFHEDCVNIIMKDLIKLMDPRYIEVTGFFTPRGGISIHPYANYGRPGTKYEALAEKRLSEHEYTGRGAGRPGTPLKPCPGRAFCGKIVKNSAKWCPGRSFCRKIV